MLKMIGHQIALHVIALRFMPAAIWRHRGDDRTLWSALMISTYTANDVLYRRRVRRQMNRL